jgi:hypothetical protein
MVSKLPVKQGISAASVKSIPDKWDPVWFRNFITNFLVNADIRNVSTGAGITITGNVSGNNTSGTATTVTIDQAPVPNDTVMGNVSGSTAVPSALNQTELTALINDFSSLLSGAAPASGGGTVNYLRADGTWDNPGGLVPIANDTVLGNISGSTATPVALTQTQLTALINSFSSTLSGATPASGGGTTNYLRADGTWDVPPGTGGVTGANPTAKVGTTAVNGSATTYMRSDAAPPIDETAAYTWTGAHTFNSSVSTNDGLTATPPTSGAMALIIQGLTFGVPCIRFNSQITTGTQTPSFTSTNKPGAAAGTIQGWIPIVYDGVTGYIPIWD